MANEYPPISTSALSDSAVQGRRLRYLALGIVANMAVWGVALYLLKNSPHVYTSQWSVVLLGGSGKTAPSAPTNPTPSSDSSQGADVKASYEVIATTETVNKAAAAKLGMTTDQFGKAQVVSVSGAPLLTFSITGATREEAQKKAYALQEAFQERLNQLRVQQAEEQESGFESSLGVARKRLETAQFRLSDYKVKAGLASKDQIDQLASNIESLRRLRAELVAQQQDVSIRSQRLATDLNISSQLASEAFVLRADPLFQQYIQEYSQATALLTNLGTKFGPNHPAILRETARQATAERALQDRGQLLLGRAVDATTIGRLALNSGNQPTSTARETLFQTIVTNETERLGLAARVQELDRQIYLLEQRLSILAQRSSTLDALNRDMQIAEAVFSSRLSGLTADTASLYGTYPALQVVAEPTLPDTGIIPRQRPLFIAAAITSSLITAGIIALYLRKRLSMKP